MDRYTAPVLRRVWKFAQRVTDRANQITHPTDDTDPATWDTAKKNEVVAALLGEAEQLLRICGALQTAAETTFEMSAATISFLDSLGVPIKEIHRRSKLARGTIYSWLDDDWLKEDERQREGTGLEGCDPEDIPPGEWTGPPPTPPPGAKIIPPPTKKKPRKKPGIE